MNFVPILDGQILRANPIFHPWLIIKDSHLEEEECPNIWQYVRTFLDARAMIARLIQPQFVFENGVDADEALVEAYTHEIDRASVEAYTRVGPADQEEEGAVRMEEERRADIAFIEQVSSDDDDGDYIDEGSDCSMSSGDGGNDESDDESDDGMMMKIENYVSDEDQSETVTTHGIAQSTISVTGAPVPSNIHTEYNSSGIPRITHYIDLTADDSNEEQEVIDLTLPSDGSVVNTDDELEILEIIDLTRIDSEFISLTHHN
jgi:hypothetical protein